MKRFVAGLVSSILIAGGIAAIAPAANAATTWKFASGDITLPDAYSSKTANLKITNLEITDGSIKSGSFGLSSNSASIFCNTSSFSGNVATFSDGGYAGCTGDLAMTVDSQGKLTVSSGLLGNFSFLFQGSATSSFTGVKVPVPATVPTCSVKIDANGVQVTWTHAGDGIDGYTVQVSDDGGTNSRLASQDLPDQNSFAFTFPTAILDAASGDGVIATVEANDSSGSTIITAGAPAACGTNTQLGAPGKPSFTAIGSINALTVNYSVADPWTVRGVEYQIDGGAWTRPGGTAPTGGAGGSFSVSPIAGGIHTVVLRSVGKGTPPTTTLSDPQQITIPAPAGKPGSSSKPSALPPNIATGSTPTKPVAAPPAQPVSTVSGTSNGVGTGTNGALASNTGDAGIDAPCLAKNGTLYPNLYSTVGSQLTMAPNTTGMPDPTSFIITAGALPPGMQLDRGVGVLFGVPTAAGSWVTTIQATFPNGSTKSSQFTTRVDSDAETLQYAALNVGVLGSRLSVAPTTNAPITGTTYKLVCGKLPAGLKLDSRTGTITGTPTEKLLLPTPMRVAESSTSGKAAASFLLIVDTWDYEFINYPAHPHLRVGHTARIRPTVIGLGEIAKFRMWKGKLPRGLHLNPLTGVITGKPVKAGPVHTVTIVAVTKGGALFTSTPMRIYTRR